ncbi:MAG: caspase family protein [Dechloromonas sp.]|uniref:Caspase family protein n=1 Tax=Candidatus Dechloromonas phosphorivorans TaxID=2899244 RepID=A0A935MV21_9RHOO|nr:caspase family protein [Candidatus Dechloromonas phosphorivorans]
MAQSTATTPKPQPSSAAIFAPRKALVIGNDNYRYVPKLLNAAFDAQAITGSLKSVGYQVFAYFNLDEKGFKQALRDFRLQVEGGDEVVFFFAGHGVQIGAANYLLPIDVRGGSEDQVKDEAIQLQRILDDLQEKRAKFSLAIVDACRDNPFKGAGRAIGGRGLAPTTAATGQMIMFSAGNGQQALDKLGEQDRERNGLFTRVLVREMTKPGVTVDRVLRNVRNEVVSLAKSVGHEQTPALYDQAVEIFISNSKVFRLVILKTMVCLL